MQIRASVPTWQRHEHRNEMAKTGDALAFSNVNGGHVLLRLPNGDKCVEVVVKVSDLAEIVRIFGER